MSFFFFFFDRPLCSVAWARSLARKKFSVALDDQSFFGMGKEFSVADHSVL